MILFSSKLWINPSVGFLELNDYRHPATEALSRSNHVPHINIGWSL